MIYFGSIAIGLIRQGPIALVSDGLLPGMPPRVANGRGNNHDDEEDHTMIPGGTSEAAELIKALTQYGENKRIVDGKYDESCAVTCLNGTFVGKRRDDIISFKGIPFVGAQPIGDLRWKAPVDVVADEGVYEAYYNANSPCQSGNFDEGGFMSQQGEDCLYLDIWKADDKTSAKKPVMVWIHGGAYEAGGTAAPPFDCHNFVSENPDVICVTIGYRLGVFGFFHLSHLADGADYPDAQNLGLMDQLMGLKWVHNNIAAFGGDPDNVTIWGESAGAGSVTLLSLVEGSHEYFHRVIAQSGSPILTRSPEEAIECTNEMMEVFGCKTVADLMKVDARELARASRSLYIRIMPERDGRFLPKDPFEEVRKGAVKDIDFLQGCNLNEMDYFADLMGTETYKAWADGRTNKRYAKLSDEEKALVDGFVESIEDTGANRAARLIDQIWFNAPVIRMSENQTMAGGTSYTYYFRAREQHGIELTIVFNHPEMDDPETAPDETFCKTMRRMWVKFATCGDPSLTADESPDGVAKVWPVFDLEDERVMVLDEFDIHAERESDLHIVDRDRTYFLTGYYWI